MKRMFQLLFLLQSLTVANAQDSLKHSLNFLFFSDAYYQYDFNKPADKLRPAFLYNYKRTERARVNLALIKVNYTGQKFYANAAIMAGDYSTYNLASESTIASHIFEANIGYTFNAKFSVDAGILPSHIGFESAIAKDNWNLSRSILAENSPYYETGVKLNYSPNSKWTLSLLALNGWQNIKETNTNKAWGTQVQFKPNVHWTFNSSSFIGNEKPDTARQLRLFHNAYACYTANSKLSLALLFDIGAEKYNVSNKYAVWKGAALLLQYAISPVLKTAARLEYYADDDGVIISKLHNNPFEITGQSINFDYSPYRNIILRGECRLFNSQYKLFTRDNKEVKTNASIIFCMLITFNKKVKW